MTIKSLVVETKVYRVPVNDLGLYLKHSVL